LGWNERSPRKTPFIILRAVSPILPNIGLRKGRFLLAFIQRAEGFMVSERFRESLKGVDDLVDGRHDKPDSIWRAALAAG
jgi:hypothetical protein